MCENGIHDLRVIQARGATDDTYEVVRWCAECGAVVVDIDYDGRTQPGGIMKMQFPKKVMCNEI